MVGVWNTIDKKDRIFVIIVTIFARLVTTQTHATLRGLFVAETASDRISTDPFSFPICFDLSALTSAHQRGNKSVDIRVRLCTAMGLRRNKRIVGVRVRLCTALELLLRTIWKFPRWLVCINTCFTARALPNTFFGRWWLQ